MWPLEVFIAVCAMGCPSQVAVPFRTAACPSIPDSSRSLCLFWGSRRWNYQSVAVHPSLQRLALCFPPSTPCVEATDLRTSRWIGARKRTSCSWTVFWRLAKTRHAWQRQRWKNHYIAYVACQVAHACRYGRTISCQSAKMKRRFRDFWYLLDSPGCS